MSTDYDEIINTVASGPKSAGNKSENATQHSLTELEALRKARAADAAVAAGPGFKIMQIVPSGGAR